MYVFSKKEKKKIITSKCKVRGSLRPLRGKLIKKVGLVSPLIGQKARGKKQCSEFPETLWKVQSKGSSAGENRNRRQHH